MVTKIGVFYDGNLLLHSSNYYNYVHPLRKRLSISGIHKFIRTKIAGYENIPYADSCITETHYFRGRINATEASQRGNQLYNDRVFDDILMSEGVHSHHLPLRNLFGRKEERGIDVWLSLEVYELCLLRKLDVVALIISDSDYVPLLRKLNSLGVKVMLLSWEFEYTNDDEQKVITKTSHDLLKLASYPISMQDEIESGLESENNLITDLFVNSEIKYVPTISVEDATIEMSQVLSIKNGFGFIKYPNNNLFFHYQDVIGDFNELFVDDFVEFTIEKNSLKQDVAKNVRKIFSSDNGCSL